MAVPMRAEARGSDARAPGAGSPAPLACESCHAPPPPSALFCPRCGGRLAASAPGLAARPGDGPAFTAERRQVTLLFCDLVDSVALAAGQDPEDVADVIAFLCSEAARFMTGQAINVTGGVYMT